MEKIKVGIYWAASCGGCDVSLLDIDEQILDVAAKVDFVLWPCATDTKYSDLRAYKDGSIDIVLFNGAIRTEENREIAKLLRDKAKHLVAYGSCAQMGGVIGLANLSSRKEIFTTLFGAKTHWPKEESNQDGYPLYLPAFLDRLLPLGDVVEVDYVIPGCPPPREMVSQFFDALLGGKLPEKGAVFAAEKNLCDECPRERREERITRIVRPHEIEPDPDICLLDQGIICMGPATRGGCGAVCPKANMPCTGCAGPTANITDQGATMLNTIASLIGTGLEGEEELEAEEAILAEIDDIIGTFYRFSLAASTFKGAQRE